jgi:hypothetical protein
VLGLQTNRLCKTTVTQVNLPNPEGEFNFFVNNNEYEWGQQDPEHMGVIIFFLYKMSDEEAFNKWVTFNWEMKRISLNSHSGLMSKYLCLPFNSNVVAQNVF